MGIENVPFGVLSNEWNGEKCNAAYTYKTKDGNKCKHIEPNKTKAEECPQYP